MPEGARKRFLIDGSMARGGGGFTYLVNILPHLSALAPDAEFRVLVRHERLARSLPDLPNVQIDLLPEAGLLERFRFIHREAPRIARSWNADLYFSVAEYAPLRADCPIIAAFRNPNVFTSLNQHWPLYQRLRLKALRALAAVSARAASRIMFVSADSADWIGEAVGLPAERRAVVHHGIDLEQWRRNRAGERRGGFILSVSSVYRYKNYVRLIEAYAALAAQRSEVPDLVIVGDNQDADYSREMEKARAKTGELAERIHIVGEVPYAEVQEYYRNASLFVFPSYLETFGHPLLEAMASDVPLVAADIPVFREIAGDAAFYADPFKPAALADAMGEALFNAEARKLLVKRGRERTKFFSWDRSATSLLSLFQAVLQERRQEAAFDDNRAPSPRLAPAFSFASRRVALPPN